MELPLIRTPNQNLQKFLDVLLGEASKTKALKTQKQLKMNDLTSKLAKHQKENAKNIQKENIPPANEPKPAEKKVKKTRSQKRS